MEVRHIDVLRDTFCSKSSPCDIDLIVLPLKIRVVKLDMETESGSLRQPVSKGWREDRRPEECEED